MKVLRYLTVLLSLSIIIMMQACGSGGGTTDTSGSLTMTAPTSTSNGNGTYSVSTTVTYTPPAGKSAQGIVVTTSATDSFGAVETRNYTLTSGSNSVIYTFFVNQKVGVTNYLSIVSSIGEMRAGVVSVIPAITAMSAAPIDFLAGEAAAPGTTKTTTISGGVGTYSLISTGTTNGVLTISLAGSTLTVKYVSPITATPGSADVLIQDVAGSVLTIPVSYFY
jgi:hypothetical protein